MNLVEVEVLRTLEKLGETTAINIVKTLGKTIAVATCYKILFRLEKQGVVSVKEITFDLGGIETTKVLFKLTGKETS